MYTNDETEEVWTISNLGYKVNNSKYSIFSSKRKSKKQALTQELMDISCIIAAEEVENLLSEVLTDEQIDCLRVEILYNGGNPPPSFYTKLAKQDWFTVTGTTAKEYLETDLYDFYIDIFAHDYRVSNLPEDEQSDLMESLNDIEQLLIDTYGEYADYRIYLGDGYLAETQ